MQPVPEQLARDAETVQAGYREYQELLLSRRGLKRLYGITLTLTLLLALLSALAAPFVLSRAAVGAAQRAGRRHARGGAGRLQPARGRWRAATSSACSRDRSTA